jgi:hypothetical protein
MERQYNKAMRLITEASKNIADLGDLLKSPMVETLTSDEQKNLQLALLKLVVVVKEFGQGGTQNGKDETTGTNV